ncbi:hypothetical protein [Nocardia sp. BMG51109]|uniref:hypothetical protein n=1 Tax=Nocardia sp. BMG51109 TaxID=1056816 RepID=UPI000466F3A5|nr:hypothetical protein [Nocardia sp. BMG51109]
MTGPVGGPWIYASACAVAVMDGAGNLSQVGCPSRFCHPGTMVPLDEHGRITRHNGLVPGDCPFIGYRVVMDPGAVSTPRRQR